MACLHFSNGQSWCGCCGNWVLALTHSPLSTVVMWHWALHLGRHKCTPPLFKPGVVLVFFWRRGWGLWLAPPFFLAATGVLGKWPPRG